MNRTKARADPHFERYQRERAEPFARRAKGLQRAQVTRKVHHRKGTPHEIQQIDYARRGFQRMSIGQLKDYLAQHDVDNIINSMPVLRGRALQTWKVVNHLEGVIEY